MFTTVLLCVTDSLFAVCFWERKVLSLLFVSAAELLQHANQCVSNSTNALVETVNTSLLSAVFIDSRKNRSFAVLGKLVVVNHSIVTDDCN